MDRHVDGGGALLVAGPDTLLLHLEHPDADAARAGLATFAELERSPDHVHTYRLTDLGLWNAKAVGVDAADVLDVVGRFAAGPLPEATRARIVETMGRFGRTTVETDPTTGGLVLRADEPALLDELLGEQAVAALVGQRLDETTVQVAEIDRGPLKQALVASRWPALDRAALSPGVDFAFSVSEDLQLRPYQRQAVASWVPSGTGVIVLPCGAGKTVTAIAAAAEVGANTLVLTTGTASLDQWDRELRRFTDVGPEHIGHYTADRKQVRPITLTTYQMMATRRDGRFRHIELIQSGDWGLVIYDEVHLLPAAVFNLTAAIQARRRLGLTATLVREDGREADVFTLVGPKRFDAPWSDLELQGWIAPARCTEVRVIPTDDERLAHARAGRRAKAAIAATVGAKVDVTTRILARHPGEPTLVIGTYLDGLRPIAEHLGLPLVTGDTATAERLRLFDELRTGAIDGLVVSKVANFSIDLPEVSVIIQVSGTFGSRQEEAQRLGRSLRPKADGRQANFYTVVARDTIEQEYSQARQRFLTEQGYQFEILDADEL